MTTNELHDLLSHIGYQSRPQQETLFNHLCDIDHDGTIVQAGTGVGKSIAVIAAAVHAYRKTGIQSLIVTPTRVLMDQYMAKDIPSAAECFGLDFAELRGKRWYHCDLSADYGTGEDSDEPSGCLTKDVGCSMRSWLGIEDDPDVDWHTIEPHELPGRIQHRCDYQEAKYYASRANIVVTNSDFWIINDRTLPDPIFDTQGAVFVDEAHQLEAKLKDYAGRSVRMKELDKYYGNVGQNIARAVYKFREQSERIDDTTARAIKTAFEVGPEKRDNGTIPERAQEIQEALGKMVLRLESPGENCLIWSDGWSLKMDFIDISTSAAALLTARPFGLVSATIPSSMAAALGVAGTAEIYDVGHPFDYGTQAVLRIADTDGSYRYAGTKGNLLARVNVLAEEIEKTKGGCLLLFSSFADMNRVYEQLAPSLIAAGRQVLRQKDEVTQLTNEQLAEKFKADGKAVLFGSESFATGFDVPGDALELVAIWKLPYPGKDPVTDALSKRFYLRYKDLMLTRIVQAAGRLIRTETDRGRLVILDSRAVEIVKSKDLMVRHLAEFGRP
jgi:Rad3-related DNA helicase